MIPTGNFTCVNSQSLNTSTLNDENSNQEDKIRVASCKLQKADESRPETSIPSEKLSRVNENRSQVSKNSSKVKPALESRSLDIAPDKFQENSELDNLRVSDPIRSDVSSFSRIPTDTQNLESTKTSVLPKQYLQNKNDPKFNVRKVRSTPKVIESNKSVNPKKIKPGKAHRLPSLPLQAMVSTKGKLLRRAFAKSSKTQASSLTSRELPESPTSKNSTNNRSTSDEHKVSNN